MRWPARPIKSIQARVLDHTMGTITRVQTQAPVIALTFDDGPHPVFTPRVLDLLHDFQARATFFVVGQAVEQHPELTARIRAEGHALGNHTYSHVAMSSVPGRVRRREVLTCKRLIAPQRCHLFRPPWGLQTKAARFDLLRMGYRVVTWDIIAEDWLRQDPADLAQRIISKAIPGSIVLLHDAVRPMNPNGSTCHDRGYMIDALAIILTELSTEFRFLTVPEMLKIGRPLYRPWFVKSMV